MAKTGFATFAVALMLLSGRTAFAIDYDYGYEADDEGTSGYATTGEPEVIHERYPNRAVKIERHVIQDAAGNYLNHGSWTHWDEKGNLIAQGQYNMGTREGEWMRWYGAKEGKMFADSAAAGFERPFGTEATFSNGQIDGVWKVFDAKKRVICEWEFQDGERIGRSAWYLPNGTLWQEVTFKNGQMDGELRKLGPENKLVVKDRYIDGHRHAIETKNHKGGQKQSEGWMLYPLTYADATYDWWTGTVKVVPVAKDAKPRRHGHWTRWYPSGQMEFDGTFEYDAPVGKFSWWHSNGQLKLTGQYHNGAQDGLFIWWYPSGQKQVQGEFTAGVPTGKWLRWTEEGKVAQAEDYRNTDHAQAEQEEPQELDQDTLHVGEALDPATETTLR